MLLEVQNVSKKYMHNSTEFFVIDNINLSVDKGDFIAICGHSGSGKSTLFHMISGLLKPENGKIIYDNKDIVAMNDAEIAHYRNSKIGYILQGQSVLKNFTVLENICLPFYMSDRNDEDIHEKALELLKKVGLESYAKTYPNQLSGGQMRRVAIARALINSPKLLIADEPTSNLDRENAVYVMELLKQINDEGISVIMSTHDDIYKDYVDKVYIIDKGILRRVNEEEL